MSSKKGGFVELLYGKIMPKVYGIGAAVVIVGAMFKILHLPGANLMIGLGLSTEAVIFFLSAFEPAHKEIDWTKVYPELAEEYDDYDDYPEVTSGSKSKNGSVAQQLDGLLESNKIDDELIQSLGDGMRRLSSSVNSMSKLGDAAGATTEYTNSVKAASKTLTETTGSYANILTSIQEAANASKDAIGNITESSKAASEEMANASKDAKEYHTQLQGITKNLGALNAVYEMELQDSNQHVKALNSFYSNLTNAMESMTSVAQDAEQFKGEVNKLTTNLASLNDVYGKMLSAMKG